MNQCQKLYYRKFCSCSYPKDKTLHSAVAKGIIIGDSDNNENNDVDHTCHHRTKQTNGPQPPPPLDAKDSIFQNVLVDIHMFSYEHVKLIWANFIFSILSRVCLQPYPSGCYANKQCISFLLLQYVKDIPIKRLFWEFAAKNIFLLKTPFPVSDY